LVKVRTGGILRIGFGRGGNREGTENWVGIGLSSAAICAVKPWERNRVWLV